MWFGYIHVHVLFSDYICVTNSQGGIHKFFDFACFFFFFLFFFFIDTQYYYIVGYACHYPIKILYNQLRQKWVRKYPKGINPYLEH